jgi:hypothetical protein
LGKFAKLSKNKGFAAFKAMYFAVKRAVLRLFCEAGTKELIYNTAACFYG